MATPHFSADWFSHVIPSWRQIFQLVGWGPDRPLTAIEIGSYEGRSALWLLDNLLGHADSRLYCVDLFDRGVDPPTSGDAVRERFDSNISGSPHAAKVEVLAGPSFEGLNILFHRGIRADLIYVDGSHRAPEVLEDLVLGFRLAKVGGVIICDDYLWSREPMGQQDLVNAPKLAIDAFVNCNIRKLDLLSKQPLYQLVFRKTSE